MFRALPCYQLRMVLPVRQEESAVAEALAEPPDVEVEVEVEVDVDVELDVEDVPPPVVVVGHVATVSGVHSGVP